MVGSIKRVRPHVSACAVALGLAVTLAACRASPSPTPTPKTLELTVPIPVPAADKSVIDEAVATFGERLKALGITNFTVAIGDLITFRLIDPPAVDASILDAVLHRRGLVTFVPWPTGEQRPDPGDAVPSGLQPLFDDRRQLVSAEVTTASSGQPALKIGLGAIARAAIDAYTTQHINGYLPIVLDGYVLGAPGITSPITGGDIVITFADPIPIPPEALAAMIASGPLPAAFSLRQGPAQFTQQLAVPDPWPAHDLLIYDADRLLTAVGHADASPHNDNIWSQPVARDPRALVLGWVGGGCTSRPTLTVMQTDSTVSLAVWDGLDPLPSGEACAGVGIYYQVELVFALPISTYEFNLALDEGPPAR